MNRLFVLGMTVSALLLTACGKSGFSSQLSFNVSNEVETKAVLNGADESGIDITWEEGDLIKYEVEVFRGQLQDPEIDMNKALDKVEGKLVYENGSWVTYESHGSSFKQVDHISVRSSTLESVVRSRFQCQNGNVSNPDYFVAVWVRTDPFAEGQQTILVKLPFVNSN